MPARMITENPPTLHAPRVHDQHTRVTTSLTGPHNRKRSTFGQYARRTCEIFKPRFSSRGAEPLMAELNSARNGGSIA
jgi:hypothetical protein